MTETIFLVHSGDASEHVWDFWYYYYKENFKLKGIDTIFLSENYVKQYDGVKFFNTGDVPWSDGLIEFLQNADCKYVIYHHEDYFLTGVTNQKLLNDLIAKMEIENVKALRICDFWGGSLNPEGMFACGGVVNNELSKYTFWQIPKDDDYLISHQGTIWEKDFFLSTLQKGENPWQHEIEGTKRLRNRDIQICAYREKSPIPYKETIVHGTIRTGCEALFSIVKKTVAHETTLALNMIVGPGESFELNRCLQSVIVDNLFNEIVIVTTSHDPEVERIAKQYTDKVLYFEWIKDFSAARNFALQNTKSTHVMWLDADDVVDAVSKSRLIKMKEFISKDNHNIFLVPYIVDKNTVLLRERIFRRRSNIKWHQKIHEHITPEIKVASFKGISVIHKPEKENIHGILRNIDILQKEYKKDSSDPHYAFYYARDLMLAAQKESALIIYNEIIQKRLGTRENLFLSAFDVAVHYTYKDNGELNTDTISLGENYARLAISFDDKYAEPFVILGDIYEFNGKVNEAINLYKTAMSKTTDGTGLRQIQFYEFLPADRLSKIYAGLDGFTDVESALYYNKLALKHDKENKDLINFRKKLLDYLIKE